MKILLLGEYSALYQNLKHGLEYFGHEVLHAGWRDGFKRIPVDLDLDSVAPFGLDKIIRRLNPFLSLNSLTGYDVVLIINPYVFYSAPILNKLFFKHIIRNNNKVFLSAAGDDAYFWKYGRARLKYGPFDDFLKFDLQKKIFHMDSEASFKYNKWLVDKVNGVIPIMFEYEISYRDCEKLSSVIPIPMNLSSVGYTENNIQGRIKIFHGLNRYGFKGTRHVEKAFEYLSAKYKNDLDLSIRGHMSLNEYLDVMRKTNIVLDQVYSYSLGVNGVYALAMGKVVFGGAEPESLCSLRVSKSPVVNILPDWKDIVKKVENILDQRKNIKVMGMESRLFAENIHDSIIVAEKYLRIFEDQ